LFSGPSIGAIAWQISTRDHHVPASPDALHGSSDHRRL